MLIITIITFLLISGCTENIPSVEADAPVKSGDKQVNLIYYTIGTRDEDLLTVNNAVNSLLQDKLGITIDYRKIRFQEYEERLRAMIASNSEYDIAFGTNYATYAQEGAFLRLDKYLETIGKPMYEVVHPTFWRGVRMMDGGIYGVPTNKELAVQEQWMYPAELIEKYSIDITKYNTLESLEPLLAMIKENEPEYQPMELDRDAQNYFALYGYENPTDKTLPFMVLSLEAQPQVVNISETSLAKEILQTIRHYYQSGYINEDAALRSGQGLVKDDKVFWKAASGGPYSNAIWSKDRGYTIVAHAVTPAVATTESTRGGVMAINSKTAYPEESVLFLNLLNTDAKLRNLFNFGIEGIHYELDENGQVERIPDSGYVGVQYTQGNWFLLYTFGGDPLDKWEQYRKFNDSVRESTLLGFTPDFTGLESRVTAIVSVMEKYRSSLLTGSVDVDTQLPEFIGEMRGAGSEQVREQLQKQIDEWIANKK